MAVWAADKVGREINRESLRAAESQGGTTITIGHKPPYRSWPAVPMGGWRYLKLKDTPPPSLPRVPVEDILQEVPEEGQQEEEDAFDDAPSVDAAAMATEGLGVLEGVVATPAASSTPPLAVRRSKRQLSSDKDYAALAGIGVGLKDISSSIAIANPQHPHLAPWRKARAMRFPHTFMQAAIDGTLL